MKLPVRHNLREKTTLREKYLATSWLTRLGFATTAVILASMVAAKAGYDAGLTALGFVGLLVAAHIALRYPTQLMTSLVVLGHVGLMLITSTLYGSMLIGQFGYGAVFVVIAMNLLASILLTVFAVKKSAGKLWLTLMLTFLCLDLFGAVFMAYSNILSALAPVAMAALMTFLRCIHWRNLFSRIRRRNDLDASRDKFRKFRTEAAVVSVNTILEAAGANIRTAPEKAGPINTVMETADAVYYMTIIKSPAIKIFGEGVSTDGTLLDPLLVDSYAAANRLHNGIRGLGKNREMRVLVVNANSKEGKEQTLELSAKGFKRGATAIITLSSPSAVLRTAKSYEPSAEKKSKKEAVLEATAA